MKKILITGGMGFIGTNLTNKLLSLGYRVISIDNFFSSKRKIINHNNFTFIEHDIINKIPTIDCDFIFHLACPASPKQYLKDTIYTLDVNYLGTKNVLDFAKNKKIPILFSSTSEIYGDPLIPVQHEKYFGNVYPPSERSSYDEGKRVAETLVYNYHIKYDMPVQITRHFNTYGPYMDSEDGRVISNFIIQGLTNKKMTIYGDGSQTRSFCYIDDCINALIKFLENYKTYHGPINIGNTNEMKIIEIADFISDTLEIDKNYIFKELPKNDPKIRKPDISKINKIFNWKPKIDLKEGIVNTINYFRETI